MLQGTGSDVGKTVLVAGLCRLAANRGLKVRPFKPQNMSNNAAVSDDGGEIGRAQWLQSLAARTPSSVHMNPVLLKPQSENGSQIIVQGKVFGQARARDYQRLKPQLVASVLESYGKVCEGADLVIVEGAGSPAEINLRAGDIANMGFATRANVPVVLVGDIDRGGVIASLVGTHAILPEEDRRLISGYIINKFRGDVSLFDDGIASIGQFTGWPCFGVVPWLKAAGRLPAEDSVVLERLARGRAGALKIAVPVLPRIANFDDLDPLRAEPDLELVFVRPGERLPADVGLIILPGSKSTIADLADLRAQGWDREIGAHVRRGGRVIGICGGYQMLGRRIADPDGVEVAGGATVDGLGLLDLEVRFDAAKHLATPSGAAAGHPVRGYEIHHGRVVASGDPVLIEDPGEGSDGGVVLGTHWHGLFDNDDFRRRWLADAAAASGRHGFVVSDDVNVAARRDAQLDGMADLLDLHLDVDAVTALLAEGPPRRPTIVAALR